MREITKYISDVCGMDIVFADRINCVCFEREIKDLNNYIDFGIKYDKLVDCLYHCQYSSMRVGFVDEFLKKFKNYKLDSFSPEFRATAGFMLKFVKDNEKTLRTYLDENLIYVIATYSSSHDCHDELEKYAFPSDYTDEQITEYLNECADSWYESMGYAEEAEDEDEGIEDEGPDMSWKVTSPNKYKNWTTYTIV